MCTNKEDATSAVNSGDVKITINKQQKIGTCNRGGADNPSLDFRIQTNIEFVTNKKLKICLLINILITVLCIGACFLVSYKLYSDLLQLQQEVISLNGRLQFLSKRCEDEDNDLERPKPLPSDPQAHTMERADVKDGKYEIILANYLRFSNLSRFRRAAHRNREKNRPNVRNSGIFLKSIFNYCCAKLFLASF